MTVGIGLLAGLEEPKTPAPEFRAGPAVTEESAFAKLALDPAPQGEEEGVEEVTKSNILWKPSSEGDGKLAVLFPYAAGNVTIKDAETGEILDVGQSSGASNGYADTVRFSKPGTMFQNVIMVDSNGTEFFIPDGSQRNENVTAGNIPIGGALGPVFGR